MSVSRMAIRTATIVVIALGTMGVGLADNWLYVTASGELVTGDSSTQQPAVTVTSSDLDGFRALAQVDQIAARTQSTPLGDFIDLGWADAPRSGAIGAPALPVMRELFVLPQGARLSYDWTTGDGIVVNARDLGADFLMPAQAPIEKVAGALEAAEFAYDRDAYAVDATLGAERVTVQELGIVRGQQLWLLEIRPVEYNPVLGTVTFYPDIDVDVQFDGGFIPRDALAPKAGLNRCILNPEVLPQKTTRGQGNYLVITAQAYETTIAPFAAFKSSQGYTVTTYTAPPGSSNTALKSYISGLYGGPNPPDYVLLVGDTDTIPCWTGGGTGTPDTDIQYGCMDGSSDWYPDIAIGRFSVRSTNQLQAVIDKTVYYETNMFSDPGYLTRAVFMASTDNHTVSEGTHNWVINNYMIPNGYTYDTHYYYYGATTAQVAASFSDGRFFGIFSGHGADTYWADGPPFYQSDVNALANFEMYSFVCSFSCVTGSYDNNNECFMETWLRAPNKGAIIAWGSSVNSYWTEDDILEKRLFDVIFDDDPNAVVKESGPIFDETKMRYLAHFGADSMTRRYFEMYNIMGDPALWVVEEPVPPTGMWVTPMAGLASEGNYGGPFSPASNDYTIENKNDTPLDYAVTADVPWIAISNASGTIPAESSVTVTVSYSATANVLDNGVYNGIVSFANLTDGEGDTDRDVTLTIGVPGPVYVFNMDTDPGWDVQGDWAWGQPTGGNQDPYGNPDPTAGYTGDNVYGYNLAGDYDAYMPERHLTIAALDCSEMTQCSLRFMRCLGVESSSYDHAYLRISNNGTNWVNLWQNTATTDDGGWTAQEFDISAYADNQPTVYIRWTMGPTDGSWQYCGWNIDDVEVWGLTPANPALPGDLNCDGVVDFNDINPFVLALLDAPGYATAYPDCDIMRADLDDNGSVGFEDINPFVALLTE